MCMLMPQFPQLHLSFTLLWFVWMQKTCSASVNQLPSVKSCTDIPVNSQYRRPVLPPACSPSVVLQQDLGGRHCFEEPLTFSFSSLLPRHFALPTMPELPASPKEASVGLYVGMPFWESRGKKSGSLCHRSPSSRMSVTAPKKKKVKILLLRHLHASEDKALSVKSYEIVVNMCA